VRSVNGPAANAQFGKACIVVPDQNADGFKDLIVGAPGFNQQRGAIYCISGAYLASGSGSQILWSLAPSSYLNQKNGLLFYSRAPTAVAFQGGTKCAANPTVRTPPMSSAGSTSGNDCTGSYAFDFNGWIANGWDTTLGVGGEVYAQYWSRDPQSPSHTSLSNAVRFVIQP
jgi:hypothetical protein